MIDVERVHDRRISEPYRVFVDGELLRNKKGHGRRFATMLDALSYAQRYVEKRDIETILVMTK